MKTWMNLFSYHIVLYSLDGCILTAEILVDVILNIIVKPYPELVDDYSILLKSPVSFTHTPGPFVNFVLKNLKRLSQNLHFKVHKYFVSWIILGSKRQSPDTIQV